MNFSILKYLFLFSITILISLQSYGQSIENLIVKNYLYGQAGYLIDNEKDKFYSGFNVLNIGWSRQKGNKLSAFEVELVEFEFTKDTSTVIYPNNQVIVHGFRKKRRSAEFIYNYSFLLSETVNGFSFGPTASILFISNAKNPLSSIGFPNESICACAGLGANAAYYLRLSDGISVGLSTRISLMDIGWERVEEKNPVLTNEERVTSGFIVDFPRNQFQMMLGFRFKI